MANSTATEYRKIIRLGPAIGDWTSVQDPESELNDIEIGTVASIGFDRLSPDHIKMALWIFYRFASRWIETISENLILKAIFYQIAAVQHCVVNTADAKSSEWTYVQLDYPSFGQLWWGFDQTLASRIIDRISGGSGNGTGGDKFSDIEKEILVTMVQDSVDLLSQLWKISEKPSVQFITGNPTTATDSSHLTTESGPLDTRVSFEFRFSIGNHIQHTSQIVSNTHTIRNLLRNKNAMHNPIKPRIKLFPSNLRTLTTTVSAILGRTELSMNELTNLQIGDIIPLSTELGQAISVILGDQVTVLGYPGYVDGRMGIRLTHTGSTENDQDANCLIGLMAEKTNAPSQTLDRLGTASRSNPFIQSTERAISEVPMTEPPPHIDSDNTHLSKFGSPQSTESDPDVESNDSPGCDPTSLDEDDDDDDSTYDSAVLDDIYTDNDTDDDEYEYVDNDSDDSEDADEDDIDFESDSDNESLNYSELDDSNPGMASDHSSNQSSESNQKTFSWDSLDD